MDANIANKSNNPINEEKTENSAKISNDELVLRRKRLNAERVRAFRKRKKDHGLPSSSQAELNSEPPDKIGRPISDVTPSSSRGPALSPGFIQSVAQSGESVSENNVTKNVAEKILNQKRLNAERCRKYRQKCKRLKLGTSSNQNVSNCVTSTSRDSNTSREFQTQAPENITGNANSSTPEAVICRRYRERLNARRTRAQEDPSSIYPLYVKHNGAHNLFEDLKQR